MSSILIQNHQLSNYPRRTDLQTTQSLLLTCRQFSIFHVLFLTLSLILYCCFLTLCGVVYFHGVSKSNPAQDRISEWVRYGLLMIINSHETTYPYSHIVFYHWCSFVGLVYFERCFIFYGDSWSNHVEGWAIFGLLMIVNNHESASRSTHVNPT